MQTMIGLESLSSGDVSTGSTKCPTAATAAP